MKTAFRTFAALAALTVVGSAGAATTISSSISVTASISASCTFAATPSTAAAFGAYDPTSGTANDAGVGTITARCTKNTGYTMALGVGSGAGAAYATGRIMTGAVYGDLLNYNLYTTAGRTVVWGDGTGATATRSGTGTGIGVAFNQTLSVYGRIPVGQDLSADSYADTVTIDLTY